MPRFWVYIENKVDGPVEIPSLRKIPGFNLYTQVCPEGQSTWRIADEIIEIKSYFASPPRVSQLQTEPQIQSQPNPVESNAVREIQPDPQEKSPVLEVIEPSAKLENAESPKEAVPSLESLMGGGTPPVRTKTSAPNAEGNKNALRISCVMCAYKNPRDAKVCMKCGAPLEVEVPPETSETGPAVQEKPAPEKILPAATLSIPSPKISVPLPEPEPALSAPMVEIPVTKIVIGLLIAALVGGIGFGGHRWWKKHQLKKISATPASPVVQSPVSASLTIHKTRGARRAVHSRRSRTLVKALPGLSSVPATRTGRSSQFTKHPAREPIEPAPPKRAAVSADATAPYEVLEEAAPRKHRSPAPSNSQFAVKRHSDKTLWTEKDQKAIQLAQRQRIYGGQRTILRNTEILIQILRDREYTTAFEEGKRLYLYNDMDWGAVHKEGPLYTALLTLSGGREEDGSVRQPLKFAFDVDLEQGTVLPVESGNLKANTLRGFFDESRIPPEDRSDIAKDVEEVVLAAQPGASPLALQTVVRHFMSTYSQSALTRVATAYNLTNVQKMLAHELRTMASTDRSERSPDVKTRAQEKSFVVEQILQPPQPVKPIKMTSMTSLKAGAVQYQMDRLEGKERRVALKTQSSATAGKLWETLTGYDRYTQFVPDILTSTKEGQDGGAVVIHTVSLTRFLFFVFKINVHMRIIEHPMERTLEFERIAGDFNHLKGSAMISTDPTNPQVSQITFNATFAPRGFIPDWVIRSMTQRFLVPIFDALRTRAESL